MASNPKGSAKSAAKFLDSNDHDVDHHENKWDEGPDDYGAARHRQRPRRGSVDEYRVRRPRLSRSRSPQDRRRRERDRDARETSYDKQPRERRTREEHGSHRSSKQSRPRSPRPRESQRELVQADNSRTDSRLEKRGKAQRGAPLPLQGDSFAISKGEEPETPKEKPNYGNTGLLAAASNSVTQADGTTFKLKYHEPAEARKPSPRDVWKLFVFKGSDLVDTIELGLRSAWLVGREHSVVDLSADHPSISKQHAVIQFRYIEMRNEYGDKIGRVKPYLIDLESANGTLLNDDKVPESRYLELREKDVVQFGHSTREYVLMRGTD